jgi:tRNA (cytidine/uridine-2'-O-)-methyltransferase
MRLALYEPDIPQNAGTMMRMAACLGIALDVIEPCGFLLDDRRLRRAGLDYLDRAVMRVHESWPAYRRWRATSLPRSRLALLTTRAETAYTGFAFQADDTLMVGRESGGVPAAVHAEVDARLRIPLGGGSRSLNVAIAAAMAVGEALRQTRGFPR